MSIDWFTTGAQIVNFLILVWLLKKLLFRPIIKAMERREHDLVSRQQHVESQMKEAEELKNQYKKQQQQLQIEKDEILSQTRQDAETEKSRLMQCLNEEIVQKQKQFDLDIQQQQQELGPLISRTIAEKSLSLSKKTLSQLAGLTLEQQIIERFLQNLSNLPDEQQAPIRLALKQENPATIITGFESDTAARQKIQSWFESFAPGSRLLFKQRDYLISGIALEADGKSWEWNVDSYLDELGTELLKAPGQA